MVSSYMISMFKITHSNLCVAHDTDSSSTTTFQPIVLQVPDSELAYRGFGNHARRNHSRRCRWDTNWCWFNLRRNCQCHNYNWNWAWNPRYVNHDSNYPISHVRWGRGCAEGDQPAGTARNVPKQKFIGECVCGGPVTADEMDDEDESICCKQKGCETSWVSKSDYINQQLGTYKLYSIILHVQILSGSRVDVWLMQAQWEKGRENKRRRDIWRDEGWTLWCHISIFGSIFPHLVS